MTLEKPGRAHGKDLFLHQFLGFQAGPMSRAISHADVDAVCRKVHQLEAGIEAHVGIGPRGVKTFDARQEPLCRERGTDGDGKHTDRRSLLEPLESKLQSIESVADVRKRPDSDIRGGETRPSAATAKK